MNKIITSILITAPAVLLLALPAAADQRGGMRGEHGRGWHDDIGHFERHDLARWRDGHWRHGWHDGRIGWWWLAGGLWYFYPAPVYPYPDPYVPPVVVQQPAPTVVIQQAPPATVAPAAQMAPSQPPQNWYYCEPSKAYYPYVGSCPSGWKVVPAAPPATPQ